MLQTAIIWPMIVQTALVFAIYLVASKRRADAVRSGVAKDQDFRVPTVEPEPSATAIRNIANQFELPVLFYAVSILLLVTNGVNILTLLCAWLFVVSRIFHAVVHVTSNRLALRRPAFAVGFVTNFLLWAALALQLLRVA